MTADPYWEVGPDQLPQHQITAMTRRDQILLAVAEGCGVPEEIVAATGISRTMVTVDLQELASQGLIWHEGVRASRSRPWRLVSG
ncbi:hypothetical protein [Nonomuraea sp. NPDC050786]|uniref:hypothetical protein n=1 Tax=Nonomuraea sp. NPDC050786 TaxID=3154840 RepID=UPI0033C78D36